MMLRDSLGQKYGQSTAKSLVSASGCLGPQLGGLSRSDSSAWGLEPRGISTHKSGAFAGLA